MGGRRLEAAALADTPRATVQYASIGHINGSRLEPATARAAAERARALADPTRLTLVCALAQTDELCVCDLAWIAERPQNLVSHHLRSLRAAGLVASRREGKMVLYALTAEGAQLLETVLAAELEALL